LLTPTNGFTTANEIVESAFHVLSPGSRMCCVELLFGSDERCVGGSVQRNQTKQARRMPAVLIEPP
jgi:hypothetical protein